MPTPLSKEQALSKLAALCASSEQCESDLKARLDKWGILYDDAQYILAYLRDNNYLDTQRYAVAYCRDKFRFAGWGKIKIRYMLRQKGLTNDDIDTALSSINESEYENRVAEILSAKARTIKAKDNYDMRNKIFRFGAARGYESNLLSAWIKEHLNIC